MGIVVAINTSIAVVTPDVNVLTVRTLTASTMDIARWQKKF